MVDKPTAGARNQLALSRSRAFPQFHNINRCQRLTTLHINFDDNPRKELPPRAEQYWLENFQLLKRNSTPLANISTLQLDTENVNGLQNILANLPKLHSLGIGAHQLDQVIDIVIKTCVGLRCLELSTYWEGSFYGHVLGDSDGHLHGYSIIKLAHAFPDLQVLILFGILRGVQFYVNDDDIENMARRLPNLQVLCIDSNKEFSELAEDTCRLTDKSLQSIGTHCKRLKYCQLRCSISFDPLVRDAERDLLPMLEKLHLNFHEWEGQVLDTNLQLARDFLQLFPELRELIIGKGWNFWFKSKKPQFEIEVNSLIAKLDDGQRWEWGGLRCVCEVNKVISIS